MSSQLALSALEEELLYVLYDDYLLKRSILSLEHLSVSFDNSQNAFFPWQFSFVFKTNKEQPLILENNNYEGFIQTFQTYKRMETERDEWMFLEELLNDLKGEMPRYVAMMEAILQKRAEELFSSRAFVPESMDIVFEENEMTVRVDEFNPSKLWTNAWHRFASHKKNYLSYMGLRGEMLANICDLNIVSLEEIEEEHALAPEGVTIFKAVVEFKGTRHSFSFYKGVSPTFETHIYVDSVFDMDEMDGYVRPTPTGRLLGEFFGIEKEKGYDFEKVWKAFLTEEPSLYERSLLRFREENEKMKKEVIERKVGLVVKEAYLEGNTHVIVLEDGSVFKGM